MGGAASIPSTEEEALAQGFTQAQIDEYKLKLPSSEVTEFDGKVTPVELTPRLETPRKLDLPPPPEGIDTATWERFCALTRSGGVLDPEDDAEAMGAGPPHRPAGFKQAVHNDTDPWTYGVDSDGAEGAAGVTGSMAGCFLQAILGDCDYPKPEDMTGGFNHAAHLALKGVTRQSAAKKYIAVTEAFLTDPAVICADCATMSLGTCACLPDGCLVCSKAVRRDPDKPCSACGCVQPADAESCRRCDAPFEDADVLPRTIVNCEGPCGGHCHLACSGLAAVTVDTEWKCSVCSASTSQSADNDAETQS